MSEMFNMSASPHTRAKNTTRGLMLDVIIALIPASLFGVWNFGYRSAIVILLTILSCVLSEGIYDYFMDFKKKLKSTSSTNTSKINIERLNSLSISDLSAVVTGLLLGMNLPHTVPLYIPIFGGIFAIIVVKQLFGGLGQNFMNPALAARGFLFVSFAASMNNFEFDGVTGATPLSVLRQTGKTEDLFTLFIGGMGGVIGETSALCLILGGIYLLARKVITYRIPVTYILSFAIFILLFSGHGFDFNYVVSQIFSGGLLIGAIFMATDYATSPITPKGQFVFAILLGVLTGIFRTFGDAPEGVSFAILLGNLCVPLIERMTKPVAFGKEKAYGKR